MCQGILGTTYKVQKKDSQRIYAMKVVPRNPGDPSRSSVDSCKVRLNIKRAKSVVSPFVVPLKFYFETESNRYIVVDFLSAGELLHEMGSSVKKDWAKFYIAEILCGIEYFHDLGIFDVNLTPRNILLDPRGHVKISKLDLFIDELPMDMTRNFNDKYLAPELSTGDLIETKTGDFWTIGVLTIEMLYRISLSDYQGLPDGIGNPRVTKFIEELLNPNLKTRLGAKNGIQDLIAHPWFAKIDWERLRKKLVKPPIEPELFVNMPKLNREPSDSSIISTRYDESAVMSNEPWNGLKHSNSSFLPVRAFRRSQRSSDSSSKFSYGSAIEKSQRDFDTSSEFSNDSAMGKSQGSSASSSKLSYDSNMGLSTRFERFQATERLTENLFRENRDMIINRVVENAAVIARREAENNGHDRDQVRERRRQFNRPAGDKGFLCSKCGSSNLVTETGISFWCSECFNFISRTELVSTYQTNASTISQASKTPPASPKHLPHDSQDNRLHNLKALTQPQHPPKADN